MKKLFAIMGVMVLLGACLTGCSTKTGYKEGTYNGTAIDSYGGQENEATARVVINEDGEIESVYLDTTYTTSENVVTTKKTLGDEYGMYNHPYGSTVGEWYQQVEALEQAVVENQGVDFLELDDEGKTDAVSGCTIAISALVEAINDALEQAK